MSRLIMPPDWLLVASRVGACFLRMIFLVLVTAVWLASLVGAQAQSTSVLEWNFGTSTYTTSAQLRHAAVSSNPVSLAVNPGSGLTTASIGTSTDRQIRVGSFNSSETSMLSGRTGTSPMSNAKVLYTTFVMGSSSNADLSSLAMQLSYQRTASTSPTKVRAYLTWLESGSTYRTRYSSALTLSGTSWTTLQIPLNQGTSAPTSINDKTFLLELHFWSVSNSSNNINLDNIKLLCNSMSSTWAMTPASLSGWPQNKPYWVQFGVPGYGSTITWSRSGTLPAGLSFDTVNGRITGTPTGTGTYAISVTATGTGLTQTKNYSLSVTAPPSAPPSVPAIVKWTWDSDTGGTTLQTLPTADVNACLTEVSYGYDGTGTLSGSLQNGGTTSTSNSPINLSAGGKTRGFFGQEASASYATTRNSLLHFNSGSNNRFSVYPAASTASLPTTSQTGTGESSALQVRLKFDPNSVGDLKAFYLDALRWVQDDMSQEGTDGPRWAELHAYWTNDSGTMERWDSAAVDIDAVYRPEHRGVNQFGRFWFDLDNGSTGLNQRIKATTSKYKGGRQLFFDLYVYYDTGADLSGLGGANPPALLIDEMAVLGQFTSTPLTIGNLVFHDRDANGRFDHADLGVPGVTVELYDANTNALVATTNTGNTSSANAGFYFEEGLSNPANTYPSNLAQADEVLAGVNRTASFKGTTSVINFLGDGASEGHFSTGNQTRPLDTASDTKGAMRFIGALNIATAGTYTFGINTDDGGRVRIDGSDVIVDNGPHAAEDRYGSVVLSAGLHLVEVVTFDQGGGDSAEFFAAAGSYTSWSTNFRLVGDVANGGLPVVAAGRYEFSGLDPGSYFVKIPASMFQPGAPLANRLSITNSPTDDTADDDANSGSADSGIDHATPETNGIRSPNITLAVGTEPTASETGFRGKEDDAADSSGNLTVDFGFISDPKACYQLTITDANHDYVAEFDPSQSWTVGTDYLYGTNFLYVDSMHISYDGDAGKLVYDVEVTPLAGRQLDGMSFVLTPGGFPGESQGSAITYVDITDRSRPKATIYVYQPPEGDYRSWQSSPKLLASSQNSDRVQIWARDSGGRTRFTVVIDTGYINTITNFPSYSLGSGWRGIQVGPQVGVWTHWWDLASAPTYDMNQQIASWNPVDGTYNGGFTIGFDNAHDGSVFYTKDGCQARVGLGNLVFNDTNYNNRYDVGEGVDQVLVKLFTSGQNPASATPFATTYTKSGGKWGFNGLPVGSYFVHVPAAEFGVGRPLNGLVSITGTNSGDDNAGEDGVDDAAPATNGISTVVVDLADNAEPVDTGTETGFRNTDDALDDNNSDLTVDFGFQSKPVFMLGDRVFKDSNANNIYDPGEGVDGITVQLLDSSSSVLATQITANGGRYLFTGLSNAGTYYVRVASSNFSGAGLLTGCLSLSGNGTDNGVDHDDNGVDDANPATSGVKTVLITPDANQGGVFSYTWPPTAGASVTNSGGTWEQIFLRQNYNTRTMDVSVTLDTATQNTQALWMVVTNGAAPAGTNANIAAVYLANGLVKVTPYGGSPTATHTLGTVIASSTYTTTNVGTKRTFHFNLDTNAINRWASQPVGWMGIGFPYDAQGRQDDLANKEIGLQLRSFADGAAVLSGSTWTVTWGSGSDQNIGVYDHVATLSEMGIDSTVDLGFYEIPESDFGDNSALASASSTKNSNLKIGALIDGEPSMTANASASGDDTTGSDDEDGVTINASVTQNEAASMTVTVTNNAGVPAYLNAWVDFNRNGLLTDVGEQVAVNTGIASGTSSSARVINFTVPLNAVPGTAGVRVRLSTVSSPGPDGSDGSGEVEDHVVAIQPLALIFPSNLTLGKLGQPYSQYQAFSAPGLTSPVQWSATSLPSGLAMNSLNAKIEGTPSGSAGAFTVHVTAVDANSVSITRDYTFHVEDGAATILANGDFESGSAWVPNRSKFSSVANNSMDIGSAGNPLASITAAMDNPSYPNNALFWIQTGTGKALTGNKQVLVRGAGNCVQLDDPALSGSTSGLVPGSSYEVSIYACNTESTVTQVDLELYNLNTYAFQSSALTLPVNGLTWNETAYNSTELPWVRYSWVVTPAASWDPTQAKFLISPRTVGGNAPGLLIDHWRVTRLTSLDFGDHSLLGSASSTSAYRLRLGATSDAEASMTANATATGDDITASDDEDAATVPASISQGASVTIPVIVYNNTGANAYLSAWIDFDNSGTLNDTLVSAGGERLEAARTISSSTSSVTQNITFTVPIGASAGPQRAVRFRLTDQSTTAPTGFIGTGEVEDYVVSINAVTDSGDYSGWALATNTANGNLKIGSAVTDIDSSNPANAMATGDDTSGSTPDDEDLTPPTLTAGLANTWTFNVTRNSAVTSARFTAWADWNSDGDASDSGETLLGTPHTLSTAGVNSVTLTITPPALSVGTRFVRLRAQAGTTTPTFTGVNAAAGEVEDYAVTVVAPTTDFGDASAFASASQIADAAIRMGTAATDTEATSSTNSGATIDDTTGTDDEDLVMPTVLIGGSTTLAVPVTMTAASLSGSTARLGAFIDWNGDGDVADTSETQAAQTVPASGTYNFTLTPPTGTVAGSKRLRLRIVEGATAPTFSGTSVLKGEVEDYAITVSCPTITLSPGTLAAGTTGVAYSQTVTANGGTAGYTYSVSAGALPAGLALNTSSGLISGTPTAAGSASFTVSALDSRGCSGSVPLSISIVCPAISLTTAAALPDATQFVAYNASLSVSGGTAPRIWSVVGNPLPTGLSINSSTGVISGTPTGEPGVFSITVQVLDTYGCAASKIFTISLACPVMNITPATLPGGTQYASYSQPLSATGGTTPYEWTVTSGSLPAGLSLGLTTGVISGTPTSLQSQTFTVQAKDKNNCTGVQVYTIGIGCPAITISPGTLATATQYAAYPVTFTASGGTAPYTWTVDAAGGSLPAGLNLSAAGTLSGAVTAAPGNYSFRLKAADAGNCVASQNLTIAVVCPTLAFSPASLLSPMSAVSYTQSIAVSGGTSPYQYQLTSGVLPSGLSFNTSTGAITGTPNTMPGSYVITVQATDSNGCNASRIYTLAVIGRDYGDHAGVSGASALVNSTLRLGLAVDPDPSTQVNADASADDATGLTPDDEDGAVLPPLRQGQTAAVKVMVNNASGAAGYVSAWMDSDNSGVFDAGEQFATDVSVATGTSNGVLSLALPVPSTAVAGTNLALRFRLSAATGRSATVHDSSVGEVEDYVAQVQPAVVGVGNVIFKDTNGNKVFNAGEGVDGVQVHLMLPGVSTPFATTTTGSGGRYLFNDLSPFSYSIKIPASEFAIGKPLHGTFSIIGAGSDDGVDDGTDENGSDVASPVTTGVSTPVFALSANGEPLSRPGTETGVEAHLDDAQFFAIENNSANTGLVFRTYLTAADYNAGNPLSSVNGTLGIAANGIKGVSYDGDTSTFTAWRSTGAVNTARSFSDLATGTGTYTNASSLFTGTGTTNLGRLLGIEMIGSVVYTIENNSTNTGILGRIYANLTNFYAGTAASTTAGAASYAANSIRGLSLDRVTGRMMAFYDPGGTGTNAQIVSASTFGDLLSASGSYTTTGAQQFAGGVTNFAKLMGMVTMPQATRGDGNIDFTQDLGFSICPTVTVTSASVPGATQYASYTASLTGSGGVTPHVWTLAGGSLPAGLTLSPGGGITGSVTGAPGTYNFTVQVADSYGCAGTRALSITVGCPTLTMTPGSIASGTQFASYSQVFSAATSGTGIPAQTYTWSLTGTLPTGLVFDPNTGTLSGTPTGPPGSYPITVRVQDASGCFTTKGYTLVIACPAVTVSGALPSAAVQDTAYGNQMLTASGGTAPYTWSVIGSLPTGLSLTSAVTPTTARISGTPTVVQSVTFTIRVTDAYGCFKDTGYTIAVGCPVITISPSSVGPFTQYATISNVSFSAVSGRAPYTWSAVGVPAGLSFSGAVLSGRPTAVPGSYVMNVNLTDNSGCPASASYTVVIGCNTITINNASPLVNGSVGTAYSQTLTAALSGTSVPAQTWNWSLDSGSLPGGLSLSSSGIVSGTPTEAISASVVVRVTNTQGCFGTKAFTLTTVCPTIALAPGSLPNGYVGGSYNQTITASGGNAPYTYSIKSGVLPAGLNFSASTGTITGTPTGTANVTLLIEAADNAGCKGTQSYPLQIKSMSIGNLVFDDCNNNGIYDVGDSGLAGAVVQLFRSGADNTVNTADDTQIGSSLTTASSGDYSFTSLSPGNYFLKVTPPATHGKSGGSTVNADNGIDNDNNGVQSAIGAPLFSPIINLADAAEPANDGDGSSDTDLTLDFGVWSGTRVGNLVWNDANNNGTKDVAELGIGGLAVQLMATGSDNAIGGTGPAADTVAATTTTAADGSYGFLVYTTGNYFVRVMPSLAQPIPSAVSVALDNGVDNDSNAVSQPAGAGTAIDTVVFALTGCETDNTMDLGLRSCPTIEIVPGALAAATLGAGYHSGSLTASGGVAPYVWSVMNGALPTGLALNTTGSATAAVTGTPSGTAAAYNLTLQVRDALGCIATRSYTIAVSCPVITITPEVLPTAYHGTAFAQSLVSEGSVGSVAWSVSPALPAGLALNPSTGAITGTVTATPGDYALTFTSTDSNNCMATKGYTLRVRSLGIGNLVWDDLNHNGVKDVAETGLAGAVVQLYRSGPDNATNTADDVVVGSSVTTTGSGAYAFSAIAPGNYFVKVTPPAGWRLTGGSPVALDNNLDNDNNGLQPGGPSTPLFSPIVQLSDGTEPTNDEDSNSSTDWSVDFGIWTGFTVGDVVWNDTSGDGFYQSGTETGISGITVELMNPGSDGAIGGTASAADTVVATTTTNASGAYGFTHYVPGSYYVRVSPTSTHGLAAVNPVQTDNAVNNDNNGVQPGGAYTPVTTMVFGLEPAREPGTAGAGNGEVTMDLGLRACPTISISPVSLGSAAQYQNYSQTFTAAGGVSAYTWSVVGGTLPAGLSLATSSSTTATISGVPTAAPGSYSFTLQVRDALGCLGTRVYSLSVACPAITLNPASISSAVQGAAYSASFNASISGTSVPAQTFTWSLTGTLPAGLSFTPSTATLSGTPTGASAPGTYPITVRVENASGCFTTRGYSLVLGCPVLTVSPGSLPAPTQYAAYSQALSVAGGTGPYTWSVSSGSLPQGLVLNSSTGVISGTPTLVESRNVIVKCADKWGCFDEQGYTLAVGCPPIVITPSSLSNITQYTAMTAVTFSASGGTAPYVWSIDSATPLPAGLSFNAATATLSGTATAAAGVYPITVKVVDASNCPGSAGYSLTVLCPTISISPASLSNGTLGTNYSSMLTATMSGTTVPAQTWSWSLQSGSLPTGLSLNGSTGLLSGTPTIAGTYNFTVKAATAKPGGNPELEFSTYNLDVNPGETFNIRHYIQPKDGNASRIIDWSQVTLTYTLGGANDQTSPADWNLANFNAGTPVTVTAADAGTGTGNAGQGEYRIYLLRAGQPQYDDHMTIRVAADRASSVVESKSNPLSQAFVSCFGTRPFTITTSCPSIAMLPATLPSGFVNAAYSTSISASGGNAPYTYALTSGTLPSGISFNTSTGVLSGTPLATASTTLVIEATDQFGCKTSTNYPLQIKTMGIGNLVFDDCNNNGVRDAGDLGLAGATVQLFQPGADNAVNTADDVQVGANQVTTSSGAYSFTHVPPGNYFVKVSLPASHQKTGGTVVTLDNRTDHDNNGTQSSLGAPLFSPVINLADGAEPINDGDTDANTDWTVDFGVWRGVRVGNLVWSDTDNDGLKDAGENGIGGLTVQLVNPGSDNAAGGTGGAADTVMAATTTTGDGSYSFLSYAVGNYYIATLPNVTYALPTLNPVAADNGVDNDNNAVSQPGLAGTQINTMIVALTGCETDNTIDLGLRPCPSLAMAPSTVGPVTQYVDFTTVLTASGGTAPYTWSVVSGTLPSGLTLTTVSSSTATISGTPTALPTTYSVTLRARDALGCAVDRVYPITVNCPGISMTPAALPSAMQYAFYSQAFAATTSGTGVPTQTYTWSVLGTLPAGLSMNSSTGVLSGTPTGVSAPGNYPITVRVQDSSGCVSTRGYTLVLDCPPLTITGTVGNGIQDEAYSATLTAGGGTAPYTWTAVGGLPDGLSIASASSTTGRISGTPTTVQSVTFTVRATDVHGCTGDKLVTIAIGCPVITINPASLPPVTQYNAMSPVNFSAVGGRAPYTWSASGVPAGLVFTPATARLSGTPAVAPGIYHLVINLTDNSGCPATKTYALVVAPPPISITPTNLPQGTVGTPYAQAMTATISGTGVPAQSWTWSLESGSLPAGLTLNPGTGVVAGTPLAAASSGITVKATNAQNSSGTQVLNLVTVCPDVTIAQDSLAIATQYATGYNQVLTVSGGHAPYTWTMSGTLPAGLSFSAATGAITGAVSSPPAAYPLTISVSDAYGCSAVKSLVLNVQAVDYGDTSTLPAAGSVIASSVRLGNSVDADPAGQQNAEATADDAAAQDDEDGVTFAPLEMGTTALVTVRVTNLSSAPAYLNVWIDFDGNQALSAEELVIADQVVVAGTNGVNRDFNVPVPGAAVEGRMTARVRLTNIAAPGVSGMAGIGEVEDYQVLVCAPRPCGKTFVTQN